MHLQRPNLFAPLLLLAACGGETTETPIASDGRVSATQISPDLLRVVVDATDEEAWIPIHLDEPGQEASGDWHISFSRFRVRLNGGLGGVGDVHVAPLPFVDFEAMERAPAGGYVTDAAKTELDDERPDFVPDEAIDFAFTRAHAASETGWYAYDPLTHVLAPSDVTYVVRPGDGRYYAMRFVDYYDEFGTPGVVSFELREVSGPEVTQTLDANTPLGLRIVDGQLVDAEGAWDIRVERTWLQTASGPSAEGLGGARWADEGVTFDTLLEAPTTGYTEDELLPLPGPPGSASAPGNAVLANWYDYDPSTHAVSPKQGILLVRGRNGDYAKLAIDSYADGVFEVRLAALPAAPELAQLEVPTSTAGFMLVDLATGGVLGPVADPAAESGWDLAVALEAVWTSAGAQATSEFASLREAPLDGFVPDEGEGAERYHPTLSGALAGESVAAVLPTEDGFAKVDLSLAQDKLRIDYVYSGPGRRTFR